MNDGHGGAGEGDPTDDREAGTRTGDRESDVADRDLHFVVPETDLPPGERAILEVEGIEIGVFNVEGEYYALANYCVHQGGPGCSGRITGMVTEDGDGRLTYDRRGEIVCCPWHGWEYDITTGEQLAEPALKLPTYDVVVRDGGLYVVR